MILSSGLGGSTHLLNSVIPTQVCSLTYLTPLFSMESGNSWTGLLQVGVNQNTFWINISCFELHSWESWTWWLFSELWYRETLAKDPEYVTLCRVHVGTRKDQFFCILTKKLCEARWFTLEFGGLFIITLNTKHSHPT